MKKTLLMSVVVAGLLFSCGGKKNAEEAATTDADSLTTAFVDEHSARNSLDYQGVYKGQIPTEDPSATIVSITLTDSTYVRIVDLADKKGPAENKGAYTWNAEGNTITLVGVDAPNQYFVGENALFQLDKDGNRITGDLADKYILRK